MEIQFDKPVYYCVNRHYFILYEIRENPKTHFLYCNMYPTRGHVRVLSDRGRLFEHRTRIRRKQLPQQCFRGLT